ncbi:MAG: transcription termination/antitermination protein NusA [Elusimicrobiaceae bacterium]|nr:transcription termination/antitermination protein NusA [Elusimicrobiaceae bacterium]
MPENAKDFIAALEGLEREKNIKRGDILKTIEDALVSALRKNLGKTAQITATVDAQSGTIQAAQLLNVVDVVTNPEMEIDVASAKKEKKSVKVGDVLSRPLEVNDFSRIAAQIAKQVLIQKVRGIERENFYNEFKPREGEVITGTVRRMSDRDIIVDLGKIEAILPYCEQIRRERYGVGSRVKAMITKVMTPTDLAEVGDDPILSRYKSAAFKMDKGQRGPYIFLSRGNGKFLEELFKVEVPEINEGIVEIKGIERDPGFRSKVIVNSIDSKIDPIGTCVGMRGIRIRAIQNELSGERIDLILYSTDTSTLISNAVAPAKVNFVQITSVTNKEAVVIVPDDQLAIAIGKDWQNIRLASRLTGWKLDVKSESQKAQEGKEVSDNIQSVLANIEGVGPKTAELLQKAGFTSVEKLANVEAEHLCTVQGIGDKTAVKIIEGAKKYLEGQQAPTQEAADDNQENN